MRFLGVKIHGGFTSELTTFARLLWHRASDWEVLVLYNAWPGGDTGAEMFAAKANTEPDLLDFGWRPSYGGGPSKMRALLRLRTVLPAALRRARAYAPDVIYSSQQMWDCVAASYLARRLGRPHVIHLHYVVGPWLQTGFSGSPRLVIAALNALRLDKPLDRLVSCDHVIAISDYIREDALRHGVRPDRVTTVRNPQPLPPAPASDARDSVRRELNIPPGAPLVGIVGRLDPDKGQEDTLEAFARLSRCCPGAHLVVVGDGPLRKTLASRAAHLGVNQNVRLTGYRKDVPRLLAAMDVFSHPSRREPFGLAVAEASGAGLPIVAYAEGGIPEIVEHERTGLLVAPGDVGALSAALTRLLHDRDVAREMGTAGRRRIAEHFQPEAASAKFAQVLSSLPS